MNSPLQHDVPTSRFAAVALKMIIDNPIKAETPSGRMKQIGLLTILYHMLSNRIELTANNVVQWSGVTRAALRQIIDPLIARGLIAEDRGQPNPKGGGFVLTYRISDRLLDQIGNPNGPGRKAHRA